MPEDRKMTRRELLRVGGILAGGLVLYPFADLATAAAAFDGWPASTAPPKPTAPVQPRAGAASDLLQS